MLYILSLILFVLLNTECKPRMSCHVTNTKCKPNIIYQPCKTIWAFTIYNVVVTVTTK